MPLMRSTILDFVAVIVEPAQNICRNVCFVRSHEHEVTAVIAEVSRISRSIALIHLSICVELVLKRELPACGADRTELSSSTRLWNTMAAPDPLAR